MTFNLLEWSSLASKLSETLVALVDKTQAAVKARRNFQDGLRELFDLYGWEYGEIELHPNSSVWLALVPTGADENQAEKNLEVDIKEILEVPTVQHFIEQRVFYDTFDAAIAVGNYEAARMILTECDMEVYMCGMDQIVKSHLPQYAALLGEELNEHDHERFIEKHELYEIDDWAELFKALHERQEIIKRRWKLLRHFVIKRWVCFYWMEATAQTTRERDLATACLKWQQL